MVHKRLHTFDGSSALTTWLFGICLRVAAAHRRRAWFRREVPTDDVARRRRGARGRGARRGAQRRRARAALDRVLDAMDLEKRAVFVMFELDELPSDEIAAILGVPVGHGVVAAQRRAQAVPEDRGAPRGARREAGMNEPTRLRDEGPEDVRALIRAGVRRRAR